MKADGSCPVDYSIRCYNCEKPLRDVDGTDIEDIHTDSEGEDVCEACCDVCESERKELKRKYPDRPELWTI